MGQLWFFSAGLPFALELPPEAFDTQQAAFEERGQAVRGGVHPVLAARTFYVDDPNGNEVEFICRART